MINDLFIFDIIVYSILLIKYAIRQYLNKVSKLQSNSSWVYCTFFRIWGGWEGEMRKESGWEKECKEEEEEEEMEEHELEEKNVEEKENRRRNKSRKKKKEKKKRKKKRTIRLLT